MIADCRVCGIELDEQDVTNAGMDIICYQCWVDEYHYFNREGQDETD